MKLKKFFINNYRSLVNFKINDFDYVTVFYGLNNAGKSNILNALEMIFRRKTKMGNTNPENFYEGIIENSGNDFFENNTNDINFEVEIDLSGDKLNTTPLIERIIKKEKKKILNIKGGIHRQLSNNNSADFRVSQMKYGNLIIYENDISGITFFPSLSSTKKISGSEWRDTFSIFIEEFNDCVYIISRDRDMQVEEYPTIDYNSIDKDKFKSFLYNLYLNPKYHDIFEKINNVFNSDPFKFGEISFAKTELNKLEIMIKENHLRLPIKHLGSGILQTLYIISSIIFYNKKIVCIEELEQNLSPYLQNKILKKLALLINDTKFGNLQQLIISSHSSTFLAPKLALVHTITKIDGKSFIDESRKRNEVKSLKYFPKLKNHFLPSALPSDTYTVAEWDEKIRQNISDAESLFNR